MKYFSLLLLSFLAISNLYGQNITLEDLWLKGKYHAEYYQDFNWASDGLHYFEKTEGKNGLIEIKLKAFDEESPKILTDKLLDLPKSLAIEDYIVSPNLNYIIFSSEEEPIYRRSSKANYHLYACATGKLIPLHNFSKGKISLPSFSPDGKKIVFVHQNNLFLYDIETNTESSITNDGELNSIINGTCDWVYEEEFEFAKAFFWSPDSKKIAYYKFNETEVPEYNLQYWTSPYPTDYRFKYPKVGEKNSIVSLYCYSTDKNETQLLTKSSPGEKEYLPRMQWTGNANTISYYILNREQNQLNIIHYDLIQNSAYTTYKEIDSTYVEINDSHLYIENSEDFIFTSEQSGFRHIYYYSKEANTAIALTNGDFEVIEICAVDSKNKWIYFLSHEEGPLESQLYKIDFDGKNKTRLTQEKGVHQISFSPGAYYYLDQFSSLNSAPSAILKESKTQKVKQVLGENTALNNFIQNADLGKQNFFNFKTSENQNLNGWVLKPAHFNKKKKYPVLVTIYGGPGSQVVTNSWGGVNYFWYQLLAEKGYIIVAVDGRGTGGRGVDFKKVTQFNLGKYETEDLIETAKYLQTLPYIDAKRIGIFGWSYGGYLSSLAITKGADYFKTAIAVAPVTNWKYYDNIYTERYMGLLENNEKGYDENAPAYFAPMLKGNYLLIHGTGDDNVHLQNSIEMQRALIKANKPFLQFYFPDKNHGIYGGNTRYYLYKMMTDFILEKL